MTDFETWWHNEGSAPPLPGEDGEEHCKRMCEIAWSNGAYMQRLGYLKVLRQMHDAYSIASSPDGLYERVKREL
jgi:hypothetical protein